MAKFQQKYEATESNQPRTPEQQLWISVLTKAADDAIYTSDWREARMAINWFKDLTKDFKSVCGLAGYDPMYVYEKMKTPLKNREANMEMVRIGNRMYIKTTAITFKPRGKIYHSYYRQGKKRGPYKKKKKHLTGNSYYAAKRKKDPYYVKIGKLGGRPRLYNNV